MKKLIFVLTVIMLTSFVTPILGQGFYDQHWKLVAEQSKKGQSKSNLPTILKIKKQAMNDKNLPQFIKSLKAEFSILRVTYDDTKNDNVSQFFKIIDEGSRIFTGDNALVLELFKTKFVSDYYESEEWRIKSRTNADNDDLSTIETWSKLGFRRYIESSYQRVFQHSDRLKSVSLKAYQPIFDSEWDAAYFPTIFDWAQLDYIQFLQKQSLFSKSELHANKALILKNYDDLISANFGNSQLYFKTEKLEFENRKEANKKAIITSWKKLYNDPIQEDYKVVIASKLIDGLMSDQSNVEALGVIRSTKVLYPKSAFLGMILNQEKVLLQANAVINIEASNLANMPIQMVVEAKNVKNIQLKIYQVTDDILGFLDYVSSSDSKRFNQVKKILVRTEDYTIPSLGDYQSHTTALEIKPLPVGLYLIDYQVNNEGGVSKYNHYFAVSNARSIPSKKDPRNNQSDRFLWVDSQNGSVIDQAKLSVYEFSSNSQSIQSQRIEFAKDSSFVLPINDPKSYYRYQLLKDVVTGDVEIKYSSSFSRDVYSSDLRDKIYNAQIFTDRAIYRPGQLVYFKVINTKRIDSEESVVSKVSQRISLHDANGNEVTSQSFITNDFGSYHGSFVLPTSRLNGRYSLRINDSEVQIHQEKSFLVEEYKRPNFELNFLPVNTEYQYGQNVELKGSARMYSGIPMANIPIQFEVKKQNVRWRYFPWYPQVDDNENSILGEVITNEKGEFSINLNLSKNEEVDGIQIDEYAINISATDLSGETQTTQKNLTLSSVSHYIEAAVLNDVFAEDTIKVAVSTKNYSHYPLNKSYHAKLVKLQEPQRIYRNQFANVIQDLPKLTKEDYHRLFPHDRYDATELTKNWKTEALLFDKLSQDSVLELGKLTPGYYRLALYNVENKDSILSNQDFRVWSKTSLDSKSRPFLKVLFDKKSYGVGELANLLVYSAVPDAQVMLYIQNGDGTTSTERRKLQNSFLKFPIKINTTTQVLNVQVVLVAYNDVQRETAEASIKKKEDGIVVETLSFRDKLEPGTKEKWMFNIRSYSKDKHVAEVLATMYDKSLDAFVDHGYHFNSLYYPIFIINDYFESSSLKQFFYNKRVEYSRYKEPSAPSFSWMIDTIVLESRSMYKNDISLRLKSVPAAPAIQESAALEMDSAGAHAASFVKEKETIKIREDLNETAFFYPQLMTDEKGNLQVEFTSPEALTQWKLMLLAHTKGAQSAYLEKSVVTQKEFSMAPNYPRFLREGDVFNFQTKLSSLLSKPVNGFAQLTIIDALTNEDVSAQFGLSQLTAVKPYNVQQAFSLDANSSQALTWTLRVPKGITSIIVKVIAKAGRFSDGEQKAVHILPNRIKVTDVVPIFVKEGETKKFQLEGLLTNSSSSISNVRTTLELSTNPIWEVIFALPSLKNETNNSSDAVFNKWFADVIASEIFLANPRIKAVFETYQKQGLLLSNLEKNKELKQVLLDETPWVLDGKNEKEQMAMIARVFDINTMRNSLQNDWDALLQLQNQDGGFSWYNGYPSSYTSSLYILKNLGKLNRWLGDHIKDYQSDSQKKMIEGLIAYIDRYNKDNDKVNQEKPWSNSVLAFLDARQYWEVDYPLLGSSQKLKKQVIEKAKTAKFSDFTFFGWHRAALLLDQYGLKSVSKKILTYLKEHVTESETQGSYWKQNLDDWGWYSSKISNHAGALEAFNTLQGEQKQFIEDLKIWLITQKEVNTWGNSRSTAEVIFTLLQAGKSWTTPESDKSSIIWGGNILNHNDEASTGFIKINETSDKVNSSLGEVSISKQGPGLIQGGLFWQYYEDLDKVKSSETYISIKKEYYKKIKTENGEQLLPITSESNLKIGDKISVRMILNSDRPMEYVQLKDMRPSGTEPLDVISSYRWKDGLGYYQTTKDASTQFFIQYLPKGNYVFEYDLIANASGVFSTGITVLQNYYAPQMNSRTAGSLLEIAELP